VFHLRPGFVGVVRFNDETGVATVYGLNARLIVEPQPALSLLSRQRELHMTDLLQTLANCPKARSASIHDRCKAVFGQPLP
jgi:hypothetical protein